VPPFVGEAVKLTDVPAHTVVAEVDTVTAGTTVELTTITMLLLVADVDEAQAALLVSIQRTVSPLLSDVVEKVALLVPTFVPLIFH
jgi:hypothetical protein